MTIKRVKATQLPSLGQSPAEARRAMQATSGGGPEGASGVKVDYLTTDHIAAIREAEEGFSVSSVDGSFEEAEETTEPPTPSKAMDMIRQLSQDKLQLQTERDAALHLVSRYVTEFGELENDG